MGLESFVDGQLFRGTAYKAAGWRRLDDTSGYARVAEDVYVLHERPKQLWVRALDEVAFRSLRSQRLPPALAIFEIAIDPTTLEPLLLQWQDQHLGPETESLIAIDGKHLRRSGGLAIASTVGQPSQRVHATVTLQSFVSSLRMGKKNPTSPPFSNWLPHPVQPRSPQTNS